MPSSDARRFKMSVHTRTRVLAHCACRHPEAAHIRQRHEEIRPAAPRRGWKYARSAYPARRSHSIHPMCSLRAPRVVARNDTHVRTQPTLRNGWPPRVSLGSRNARGCSAPAASGGTREVLAGCSRRPWSATWLAATWRAVCHLGWMRAFTALPPASAGPSLLAGFEYTREYLRRVEQQGL